FNPPTRGGSSTASWTSLPRVTGNERFASRQALRARSARSGGQGQRGKVGRRARAAGRDGRFARAARAARVARAVRAIAAGGDGENCRTPQSQLSAALVCGGGRAPRAHSRARRDRGVVSRPARSGDGP